MIDLIEVSALDLDLKQEQEYEGQILWERFANKPPESLFSRMSQDGWRATATRFAERLKTLATDKGLESEILAASIEAFTQERIGKGDINIPVAAYRARYGEQGVWIVLVKWEGDGFGSTVGHIRIGAFTIPDCERVDYVTCN